jgi:hypothetical protein
LNYTTEMVTKNNLFIRQFEKREYEFGHGKAISPLSKKNKDSDITNFFAKQKRNSDLRHVL